MYKRTKGILIQNHQLDSETMTSDMFGVILIRDFHDSFIELPHSKYLKGTLGTFFVDIKSTFNERNENDNDGNDGFNERTHVCCREKIHE